MNGTPRIMWKLPVQCWFFVGIPFFFLLFNVFYRPFGIEEWLNMGSGLFYFNITIMMCIVMGSMVLTRLAMFFLRRVLSHRWLTYAALCLLEAIIVSAFLALFVTLMSGESGYFIQLAKCIELFLSTAFFPYIIISLSLIVYAQENSVNGVEDAALVRFNDSNKQLKFVVADSAILFIAAEENYIRIHYQDGDDEKNYLLRSTMTAVESVATKAGLVRCQRSYYINPSHVKALRKETNGAISAELDIKGIVLPVSKKAYPELSSRI